MNMLYNLIARSPRPRIPRLGIRAPGERLLDADLPAPGRAEARERIRGGCMAGPYPAEWKGPLIWYIRFVRLQCPPRRRDWLNNHLRGLPLTGILPDEPHSSSLTVISARAGRGR